MLDFTRRLAPLSALSFALWKARRQPGSVTLALRSGLRFELRGGPLGHLGNNDYGVAYEVFVLDYYNPVKYLPSGQAKLVVDLGANVGFSTLYFLQRFQDCHVISLEPHPRHFEQAQRNLELNGARDR